MPLPHGCRLSVVIPVLNDARRLRSCLAALRRDGVPSTCAEVVVVDNGSTDGSRAVAEAGEASVLVLPGLRVAELRNQGAERAKGELLAFVDADHEIVEGWSEAACKLMVDLGVGAVGATYLPPPEGTWVQHAYGCLRGRTLRNGEVAWIGSGNLVVRRDAFEQVKGFDITLEACEDVDLCDRLRARGWRILADPRLGSIHHGDPASLSALFKSELWRGRDNLRVSLRHPTVRGLPSIAIPIVDLACLLLIPALAIGGRIAAGTAAAGVVVLLSAFRAIRMVSSGVPAPVGFARALVVAGVYDVARALALVVRARHRRARQGGR